MSQKNFTLQNDGHQNGPEPANVQKLLFSLEASMEEIEVIQNAQRNEGAIAFVHFDANSSKSNMVEVLIHHEDLMKLHRGLYVRVISFRDGRNYTGRVVEGPFFAPDALKRDSTPVQFIILNQGQAKSLTLPEYHGWAQIEILGEERNNGLYGATRRPHPGSPAFPYDSSLMKNMLHMEGNIILGTLDNYDDILVRMNEQDKNVLPRNLLTVGTIGSGKSNTTQTLIEESLSNRYSQIVIDPEGEYIFMDQPSDTVDQETLQKFNRKVEGVKKISVYRPPKSKSKRPDAMEFSVPFWSLSPEIIVELTEMNTAQETRFTFLYERAIKVVDKENGRETQIDEEPDVSQGYKGITLNKLIEMLNDEMDHYNRKKSSSSKAEDKSASNSLTPKEQTYFEKYHFPPLIQDQQDAASYGALRKLLRKLSTTRIFDRTDAKPLDMDSLSEPGHLTVIDMSDAPGQKIVNIVIADLLSRMFSYKMLLTEEKNIERKVCITIEEAHGFVSREKRDKMEQTLDQLRRIARRGRKRWLILHFVTQSPQHLPPELFELANNKIIHQTTGTENLRVLKAAAGNVNEGIWDDVPSLGRGRAIVISGQYPHPIIVQIRPASSKRNYSV